jgi:hypothetical protein
MGRSSLHRIAIGGSPSGLSQWNREGTRARSRVRVEAMTRQEINAYRQEERVEAGA